MTSIQPARKRPNIRRAVILFPSGLTLGNLFFGIFAIITASRGDFRMAGIYVIWGGIFDALDGRLARVANAGTQFGEELDSLVDAISFGLAPAMIMYFAVLNTQGWDWIFVFLFAACAVMRLARFNIEQAGTAKTYFQGLPSPAAGITLASYYWFSQSWLYSYGAIGDLPWQVLLRFLMATLAFLMISNVPYPVVPRIGFRSLKAIGSSVLVLGSMALLATGRLEFFFPLCIGYMLYGLLRSLISRMFERRQPTIPYDLSEGEDDEEDEEANYPMAAPAPVRSTRPARPERSAASPREDAKERTAKPEDRPARPDRKERPQRTEAERAARREKREKREARGERTPRPPRTEALDNPPEALALDAATADAADTPELVGAIPGGAEVPAAGALGDAPARKRKRRRRRGERKERGPTAAGDDSAGDDSAGGDDGDDDGGSDSPDRERSPYAAFPASMPPIPTAVPSQPPAPVQPPSSPANPDSHE